MAGTTKASTNKGTDRPRTQKMISNTEITAAIRNAPIDDHTSGASSKVTLSAVMTSASDQMDPSTISQTTQSANGTAGNGRFTTGGGG